MESSLYTKQLHKNGFCTVVWKNWTGLHRELISTPPNTFAMNWNPDCET